MLTTALPLVRHVMVRVKAAQPSAGRAAGRVALWLPSLLRSALSAWGLVGAGLRFAIHVEEWVGGFAIFLRVKQGEAPVRLSLEQLHHDLAGRQSAFKCLVRVP